MPNLNQRGKIQLSGPEKISMCSSGSGGFLKSLHKFGVLKILEKTDIQVINLVSSKDLNPRIADPKLVSLLTQTLKTSTVSSEIPSRPTTECLIDGTKRNSSYLIFPTLLQEQDTGKINSYYPDESLKIVKRERGLKSERQN